MARDKRFPWYWFETLPVTDTARAKAVSPLLCNILGFQADMDKLFRELAPEGMPPQAKAQPAHIIPHVDIAGHADGYLISAELPGVPPENVRLELKGNRLTIQGEKKKPLKRQDYRFCRQERKFGVFRREIELPDDADTDSISARSTDGVLFISFRRTRNRNR